MGYENQRIMTRHQEIIDLHLAGCSNIEIASKVGYSPVGVGLVLRGRLVQDEIARRRSGIEKKVDKDAVTGIELARMVVNEAAVDAAEALRAQVLGDNVTEGVRQSAASKILEIAFGARGSGGGSSVTIINLGQIDGIKAAREESAGFRKVIESKVVEEIGVEKITSEESCG